MMHGLHEAGADDMGHHRRVIQGYPLFTHGGDSTAPTTAGLERRHGSAAEQGSCRCNQSPTLGVTVLVAVGSVLRAPAATDRLARCVEAVLFFAGVPVPWTTVGAVGAVAGALVAVRPTARTPSWTDAATDPASRRPVVRVRIAARWVSCAALRTVVTAPLPRDTVLPAWATRSLVDFWLRTRLTILDR